MTDLDLHEVLDKLDPGPVPMEEITTRATRIRRRRAGLVLGSAAAVAVIAFALIPHGPGPASPAQVWSKPGGPVLLGPEVPARVPLITNGRPGRAGDIAAGLAGPRSWRISLSGTQVPGMGCLPAIAVSGGPAAVLFPAASRWLISGLPRYNGTSFEVFRAPAGTVLSVSGGTRLAPVTATACGRRIALAALAFDTVTGATVTQTAPSSSFTSQVPPALPGTGSWQSANGGAVPGGALPAGQLRRLASGPGWNLSVMVRGKQACAELHVTGSPLGLEPVPECQSATQNFGLGPTAIMGAKLLYGYIFQASPGVNFATVNPVTGSSREARVLLVGGLRLFGYAGTTPLGGVTDGSEGIVFSQ